MIDTHCHLDDPRFDPDRDAVLLRARASGVTAMVIPSVSSHSWLRTLSVTSPTDRHCALGVHPHYTDGEKHLDTVIAALAATIALHRDRVVAVGECGLDGAIDTPIEVQLRWFRAQLNLAACLDLPVILHVYRAHDKALGALRSVRLPERRGVIHAYSGGADLAREYLSLGFFLSFGGAITRPRARRPVESLRTTPIEKLLFETDAPDQLPSGVPDATRRCEPCHLGVTVGHAEKILALDREALVERVDANARALFGLW